MADPGGGDQLNGSFESLLDRLRQQNVNSPNTPPHSMPDYSTNQLNYQQNQTQSMQQSSDLLRSFFPQGQTPQGPQAQMRSQSQPLVYQQQQPNVSSPLASPPLNNSQTRSGMASPFIPPPQIRTQQSNAERTASLLSLLKFPQASSSSQPGTPSTPTKPWVTTGTTGAQNLQKNQSAHGRAISATDLVASFMSKPTLKMPPSISHPQDNSENKDEVPEPNSAAGPSPQDVLLQLLNRPKPSQNDNLSEPLPSKNNLVSGTQDLETDVGSLTRAFAITSIENPFSTSPETSKPPVIIDSVQTPMPDGNEVRGTSKLEPVFTYVNPFEQLAASSPRNRTPISGTPLSGTTTPAMETGRSVNGHDSNKRKNKDSPEPMQAHSRRKLSPKLEDLQPVLSSPPRSSPLEGSSQIDAATASDAAVKAGTVKETLDEVGRQVTKEVEEALDVAAPHESDMGNSTQRKEQDHSHIERAVQEDIKQELRNTAAEIREQLEKPENEGDLEDNMPDSVAEAVRNAISNAAEVNLADSWESDDGEDTPDKEEELVVPVYNFPMKPFVAITLKIMETSRPTFRAQSVMDVARLRKDFDQIDRTLATATNKFIVYALPKNGGYRIIRQADGRDKQIFRDVRDRIFNVSVSAAWPPSAEYGTETVLGTGLSGTVYWTLFRKPSEDFFDEDIESYGFILPPTIIQEAHTSGGQLKTRAKTSSCHPEFFAVGRGKSIFIVFPFVARGDKYTSMDSDRHRVVDSERYFTELCLKINTGKAGKDFAFSGDDTTIVSLDKAGRVRVWDVQDLVDKARGITNSTNTTKMWRIEVDTPIMTLMTAMPSEKAWPTSVQFVDKLRPYIKCTAQRYLIVGLKQNHTLQLWDIGLGRAVQELNFPHEKESDAICSIAYHPASGIIIVGHPTRNSIYFIHLSAPRYNLPPMSQAHYVQLVTQKDPSIQKPDSTAIMSGLREFSFATKGQLRSLDILSRLSPSTEGVEREDSLLFELYCMHSNGLSCIAVTKEDLGWSKDARVLHPVDAEAVGLAEIASLRETLPVPPSSTLSQSAAENDVAQASPTALATKPIPREIIKKSVAGSVRSSQAQNPQAAVIVSTLAKAEGKNDGTRAALVNGGNETPSKPEKGRRNRKDDQPSPVPKPIESSSYAIAARRGKHTLSSVSASPSKDTGRANVQKSTPVTTTIVGDAFKDPDHAQTLPDASTINLGISSDFLDKEMKKVEQAISAEFSKVITRELAALYTRFDEDKRIQQATGDAKQDAILRLISSTLSENVEKTLGRIIQANIQQTVLPSIADVTATTLDRRLAENLSHSLGQTLPRELKSLLPDSISRAVQSPDVLRVIADSVARKLAGLVGEEFAATLHSTIVPTCKAMAIEAAKKVAGDVEHRTTEQLRRADIQRHNDSMKIDQLTSLVRGLSETVHTMAAAQAEFQNEILKLQRQLHHPAAQSASVKSGPVAQELSPEEQEAQTIAHMLENGRTEEGAVMWLQSGRRQAELFDRIFARQGPGFVRSLSPLVMLSVAAAITTSFESFPMERLQWLENILLVMDPLHPEVREMVPKIMDVLIQRMEEMYMRLSESQGDNPALKKLPVLWRKAKQLKQTTTEKLYPGGVTV